MTMTLSEFLEARIAEDEAVAGTVADGGSGQWQSWNRSWDPEPVRDIATDGKRIASVHTTLDEFMCRHDPARVLAECEAKRRIVERCTGAVAGTVWEHSDTPVLARATLSDLGLSYADHPDYRQEWRP